MRIVLSCLLAVFQVGSAQAQMPMAGHMMMEERAETPPADLPVPQKMTGIGNSSMQITATPEAQMWFNQGLNLLHDFWEYESPRAFEQSARVDPQCAMCYWGLYKAEAFYHSLGKGYASEALAKAVSLKGNASKREALYIEASAAPFSQQSAIMRKLISEYPDDLQAQIFLGGASNLEAILKEHPDDSAANHYYVHALESSDHPEKALHSAEILRGLAPASGHMVHMPGHIYFRLGDYARAEEAFTASTLVDESYMREQHVEPENGWNYVHNLMYAIANLMEEGKFKQATLLSTKLTGAGGELDSTLYLYSARDSISRIEPHLPVALRTADWPRIVELTKATALPAGKPNLEFLARQLTNFAQGMQAVESHDLKKASEFSNAFDADLERMSQHVAQPAAPSSKTKLPVLPDAMLLPILSSLSIMSSELRGSLLTAQGDAAGAKSAFTKAGKAEEDLGYHEPPNYIRPVGETEGAALMSASDWKGARVAYERALKERPHSGLVLYQIAMSSEKSGNRDLAAKEYNEFLAAWKDADPDLPQLAHARAYLATRTE